MKKSGFTLVELMIVIAIMAILAALALPNFQNSIRKARHSDAQSDLMEFAGNAERVFTQSSSYASLSLSDGDDPDERQGDHYTYTLVATEGGFTIKATPKDSQTKDGCGTMTLDQRGVKTFDGDLDVCWE